MSNGAVTISRIALGLSARLPQLCLTDPTELPLCVYRGDTGRFRVTVTEADGTTPVDISGATWDADIRSSPDDSETVAVFTIEPVVGQTNAVDVILPATESANLLDPPYVWDLEMTLGGDVTTLLVGPLTVTPDVSRTP